MRVSEKERQGFKSEKEKEIEIETKFQTHKEYFPENPEKLRSILQGLSF